MVLTSLVLILMFITNNVFYLTRIRNLITDKRNISINLFVAFSVDVHKTFCGISQLPLQITFTPFKELKFNFLSIGKAFKNKTKYFRLRLTDEVSLERPKRDLRLT